MEQLKDIALCVARAAVIRHSTFAAGIEQLAIGVGVRDIGGIEHAISAYSGSNAMAMSLIIA